MKKITVFILVLLFAAFLFRSPNLLDIVRWNIGHLYFLQAESSFDNDDVFRTSAQAIRQFELFKDSEEGLGRLTRSYELQWQSASAIGESTIALKAYNVGHSLNGTLQTPLRCTSTPKRLEAEKFSGVLPNTINTPRVVDDRNVVLLFSTPAITQTVCLPVDGLYQITVLSRENYPPPIEIRIVWDGWQVGVLNYEQGNEKWTLRTIKMVSTSGEHELQLNFENDFADSTLGIDRDAMIDYVEIELMD